MTVNEKQIALTKTVAKGGCAAKVAATELRKILGQVQFPPKPKELLVDGQHFDDAAIFLTPNHAVGLVQTLDFFTPIVNTPRLFGRVAAANALSDVYAMGGHPKTCMAILAFPMASLSNEIIAEVLNGACEVITESKATLVGGHSIDDDTLKFGLSVTGFVDPQNIWSNNHARPGDQLILTKPLGTGTLTAGLKRDAYSENDIADALESMAQLNNAIDFLDNDDLNHIHAATDITGFGLMGHALQMAKASEVQMRFEFAKIPLFHRAVESLQNEFLTKAHRTNREYTQDSIDLRHSKQNRILWPEQILFDPQTSGGLLLAVAKDRAQIICKKLQQNFSKANIIGEIVPYESGAHLVVE